MTFGEKLQSLRQRAGMSQDQLAERLEVSRQAVSRWERDETMPETDKVVALADIFGVTTDYLLRPQPESGEAETEKPPRGQKDRVERFLAFVRRKWYLLGWVLIVWGGIDLARGVFVKVAFQGVFKAALEPIELEEWEIAMSGTAGTSEMLNMLVMFMVLYAAAKIAAGVLVLHFGKQYIKKKMGEKEL